MLLYLRLNRKNLTKIIHEQYNIKQCPVFFSNLNKSTPKTEPQYLRFSHYLPSNKYQTNLLK